MTASVYGSTATHLPATPPQAPTRRTGPLTAAAQRWDPTPTKKQKPPTRLGWQNACWHYHDNVNPAGYSAAFAGHVQSQAKLIGAQWDNPDEDPVPTDNPDVLELVAELGRGMRRAAFDGSVLTGQRALLDGVGVNKFVAGQCYLHGYETSTGLGWDLLSVLEVDWSARQPHKTRGGKRVPIGVDDIFVNLYRPHPGRRDEPVSALFYVRHELAELEALQLQIVAITNSKRGAGMWTVSDGLSFAHEDPADEGTAAEDDFLAEWVEIWTTPIKDPGSVMSVVPMPIRGPKEELTPDVFRHVTPNRDLDEQTIVRHDNVLKAFWMGVDLPAGESGEKVGTHWDAWLQDEKLVSKHTAPSLTETCEDLNAGYLWPGLTGSTQEGGRGYSDDQAAQYTFWWNDTNLVVRPDRSQDAFKAVQLDIIGRETARRELGWGDADAPNETDFALSQARETVTTGGVQRRPQPAQEGPPQTTPIAAAASPSRRLERLAADLYRIDVRLDEWLTTNADTAVRAALKRAGSLLRSKMQGTAHTALRASLVDVDNWLVPSRLGPSKVAAFGVAEDKLVKAEVDEFAARAKRRLAAAQTEAVKRAAAEVDDSEGDVLAGTEQDRKDGLTAASVLLSAGMVAFVRARLYDPSPAPPDKGEWSDVSAPRKVLRDAMTVAGGGDPEVAAPGGVGQGETAMDVLRSVGIDAVAYRWVWSGAERPFPPHQDLDGREFQDFGELENPDSFPDTAVWYPGDHDGCGCLCETVLAGPTDGGEEAFPLAASAPSTVGGQR